MYLIFEVLMLFSMGGLIFAFGDCREGQIPRCLQRGI